MASKSFLEAEVQAELLSGQDGECIKKGEGNQKKKAEDPILT